MIWYHAQFRSSSFLITKPNSMVMPNLVSDISLKSPWCLMQDSVNAPYLIINLEFWMVTNFVHTSVRHLCWSLNQSFGVVLNHGRANLWVLKLWFCVPLCWAALVCLNNVPFFNNFPFSPCFCEPDKFGAAMAIVKTDIGGNITVSKSFLLY